MITTVLAAILLALFSYFLFKKPKPIPPEGTLSLHWFFALLGFLFILLGIALLIIVWILGDFSAGNILMLSLVALVFIVSGCWTYLFYKNHRVHYSEREIVVVNGNKKEQRFDREDIVSAHCNYLRSNMYVITLKSGEEVKIYRYLEGCESFIEGINAPNRAS